MFLRRVFAALLLTGSFAVPSALWAQDDGAIKLQFKAFEPGSKPFYQLVESTATLKLKRLAAGESHEHKSCSIIIRWTPQPAEGKLQVVKRQLIAASFAKGRGFVLSDRVEVTLVFDPEALKVTEIRGRRSAERAVPHDDIRKVLEEFLGDEQLKDAARQPWFGAHRASVKKGTAWREAIVSEWPLPWWQLYGSFEGVREFGCQNWDDGKASISVVPTLCFRRGMAAPPGAGKLKKGSHLETKEGESHGTIVFDRARGRAVEASCQTTMRGVCICMGEVAEFSDDVELTQKIKFTTSYEMPELPG